MKKYSLPFLVLLTALCLLAARISLAEEPTDAFLHEIDVTTAFPAGWTVVTPDTVGEHFDYFVEKTPELAVAAMREQGVYAVAFAPDSDAALRVIAQSDDPDVQLYFDIERYTPKMRAAIANGYLNRADWVRAGYRYSGAEWSNKSGQGRMLWLTYTVREGDKTVARGRQAYTIRDGKAFTLELRVGARQITSQELRAFDDFVARTAFPTSTDMPPLPVGLNITSMVPEETHKADLSIRGATARGAAVSAWLQGTQGEAVEIGTDIAGSGGAFRLDVALPAPGEYRLFIVSSLEGFADCEEGFWISYDPKRLPVSFTSYPDGDVFDAQIVISGKTISGVTIQCMEGETNKKIVTGSEGTFSFKLNRTITGPRTVVLSMTKPGYDYRRFDISFNRQWKMADFVKHLSGQVQSLSYANLCQRAEKYAGRLVRYSGHVVDVSQSGSRGYVQLALKRAKDGTLSDMLVAVADGMEITLVPGDSAELYVEVTTETFAFSEVTEDGREVDIDLPSVKLLAYQRNE